MSAVTLSRVLLYHIQKIVLPSYTLYASREKRSKSGVYRGVCVDGKQEV